MVIGIYICTIYFGVMNFSLIPLDIIGGCRNEPHDSLLVVVSFIANLIMDSYILFLILGCLIYLKGNIHMSFIRCLLI